MTDDPNDRRVQPKQTLFKDWVIVRDDSRTSVATMLGALVAIVLIGGALLYASSGDRDDTASVNAPAFERSVPDGTTGQSSAKQDP